MEKQVELKTGDYVSLRKKYQNESCIGVIEKTYEDESGIHFIVSKLKETDTNHLYQSEFGWSAAERIAHLEKCIDELSKKSLLDFYYWRKMIRIVRIKTMKDIDEATKLL